MATNEEAQSQAQAYVDAYSAKAEALRDLLDQAAQLNGDLERMEDAIRYAYPDASAGVSPALGLPHSSRGNGLSWYALHGHYAQWRADLDKWLDESAHGVHTGGVA